VIQPVGQAIFGSADRPIHSAPASGPAGCRHPEPGNRRPQGGL